MALSRQDVVSRALALADADGLDALTLRSLAAALGVQAPSLYTHVRSKADLLDALADRILDEVLDGLPATADGAAAGSGWREWLLAACVGMRRVMLAHRDGARIVAGARGSLRRADLSELAMGVLMEAGVESREARLRVLAVERFTVGYVLEEQSEPREAPRPSAEELTARLPRLTRAIVDYFAEGRTVDDLFEDEIRLILRG